MARMFSGENFYNGIFNVGYGVRRKFLSSFGFSCTTLWPLQCGTAVWDSCIQKHVRRDSVSAK